MTFRRGHTDRNHENNKCLITSETIQAMPITFAVKIVRLNDHMTIASLMTLVLLFNLQFLGQYFKYYIQIWHDGRPMHDIYAHSRVDYLYLGARLRCGSAKAQKTR